VTQRTWYAIHRWLGAIVGLQLLAWSAGGVIFSTHAISWVRGERGMRKDPPPPLPFAEVRVSPELAARRVGAEIASLELRTLLGRPVYEVRGGTSTALVDARTGTVLSPIDHDLAMRIARADRSEPPAIAAVERIEAEPPIEYRGQPLPAWRVTFADSERTAIYVDARTGTIRARRNQAWRRYDWFWMLHTMDYGGRDDFNHPLLIGFAALGLTAVLSGWSLWILRLRKRARRTAAM
jgi:uncharacterized iron-regulated membrane protein